jgi:signal transduction histidine kinase
VNVWPFRHARLVAFFVLVAAMGAAAGLALLRSRGGDAPGAALAVAVAAATTALLGFAGVFFHRLRVLPQKWRETERYLLAIQRESAKYRALLEGAADMVLVVRPADGVVLECNARAREQLGAREGAAALSELLSAGDAEALRAALRAAAAEPGAERSLPEVRVRGAAGRELRCDARVAAVELADGRVVQVALRDRTREREIEHELAVRERLSSLGLLTAGVAHEINNPLEGIGNHVKLLEREGLAPEERRRHLELVRHGFERIRDLVRDLLRFARPAGSRGEVDLAPVVERARRLAAFSERFRGVEVSVQGLETPLVVLGDAGRLEQIVFNLLLNAATAMGGRGRIAITAVRGAHEPGWVELSVADEGPGVPPADLERIFDPFFTTSGGTGLGLSIAYGIAQAHGGSLLVRNRPQGGAEFTLRLPDPARARSGEAA